MEDEMNVSMAERALTGVNGGAVTPALKPTDQPQRINLGLPQPVNTLTEQKNRLYDYAKRTVADITRSIPPAGQGVGNLVRHDSGLGILPQKQDVQGVPGASGILSGFLKQLMEPRNTGTAANQNIDVRPMNERLTMMRSVGGGAEVPHYDYNGTSVALPAGIDVNDANAVTAAMAEQNAFIDIMNDTYGNNNREF